MKLIQGFHFQGIAKDEVINNKISISFCLQSPNSYHTRDKSSPGGFLSAHEVFPSEDHFHGPRFSNFPNEPLCSSNARNGAQVDFWLTKLCSRSCKNDIAQHCQFTASSQRVSVQLPDMTSGSISWYKMAAEEVAWVPPQPEDRLLRPVMATCCPHHR